MAEAIARALEDGHDLVIEAGTGTGKTLAYLAPVLLSGRRAVISTGTKTLQDQLYHRDLPVLGQAIGRPAHVALLKGRSNYLCHHRLSLAEDDLVSRAGADGVLGRILAWSRRTRTGDVSEVDGVDEADPIWPRVTSTADNCLGTDCRFYDRCPVLGADDDATRLSRLRLAGLTRRVLTDGLETLGLPLVDRM